MILRGVVGRLAVVWLLLVALSGGASLVHAQEADGDQTQAEMVFRSTSHNFGTFQRGDKEPRTHKFEFTNEGDAPLVLTRSSSSCKCIEVRLPKRPIAAGQSGVVEVIYTPKERGGFNKSVRIYSNTRGSVLTLFVSGHVE